MNKKINILSDSAKILDRKLMDCLEEISAIDDVHGIVGLIDLHLKERTENPSSVAIATVKHIIPKLTSVAQNCGMSLIRTDLRKGDLSHDQIDAFFHELRLSDLRVLRNAEIDIENIRRIASQGASAVLDLYNLPSELLENIEFRGMTGNSDLIDWKSLKTLVPLSTLEKARFGFGVVPSGNHFLELQYLDEVIDEGQCKRFDLRKGTVLIMLHSDGGIISDDIGNLYGNRTTATGYVKFRYNWRKALLHLKDLRSLENLGEKWKYYFGKQKYIMIPSDTYEGGRFLKALRISINAGYASRLATIGRIWPLLEKAGGIGSIQIQMLCDYAHNSIVREKVDGLPMWVHRHNAARVIPGKLVFLPGYNFTSSFVCVGDRGSEESLYSMDHGAGETIKRFMARGLLHRLDGEFYTRSYDNESCSPDLVPHFSDEGIEDVIENLERKKVIKPIARTKPFASYRFKWKGRLGFLKGKLKALSSR